MPSHLKRVLYWTPRLLCIAFIIFLSLFALDVFTEYHGFWTIAQALLMHLIPSFVLLVVLVLAWRWEWIGALVFGAAGLLYLSTNLKHPSWIVTISCPLFVIAALFLANWTKHTELHSRT